MRFPLTKDEEMKRKSLLATETSTVCYHGNIMMIIHYIIVGEWTK